MSRSKLVLSFVLSAVVPAAAIAFLQQDVENWEYKYRAKVVRVLDGDTVDAEVDLGFNVKLSGRFRLLGINAPEKNTDEGKESKKRLSVLLPAGSSVIIQTAKDKKEKYGRYLGTFLVDGKSVNQQLVDEGFAIEKDY